MADVVALAEVWLWGGMVGAVAEEADGRITFEFDPAFAQRGLEISPLLLPTTITGPVTFGALRRSEAFEGLPGVLADALPDRFGNAVIRKYYADHGRPEHAMRPVQKLLYIGDRAMGALTFRPPERVRPGEQEALDVARLVEQARLVIEGKPRTAIPEMLRVGASAGGARPKALILWNERTGEVRSGFAEPQPADAQWILKFDGVGELGAPDDAPKPYNRIEHAYARMASDAGIEMPETRLLEERGFAHLLVRRFDRTDTQRFHMHSLGGLHHVDYNVPGAFSYEGFLRTTLQLNLGYPALEQSYRRAVFNVITVNQDDHVKNIAFLMDERGTWRLAPAFDLTFARGTGYTRTHQMSLNGKVAGFVRDDLTALGAAMGVNRDGADVIDEVVEVVRKWPEYATAAGVPSERIAAIEDQLRLRMRDPLHFRPVDGGSAKTISNGKG